MARPAPEETSARAERRRQILDAAQEVFADAGYHGASIHAIIEKAEIARGTFYLYFESKEAVFAAVLDQAMFELRRRIVGVDMAPGAAPPEDQLREGLASIVELFVTDRPLAIVLLSSTWTPDAEAAAKLKAFYEEVRSIIALSLELGIQLGLVRPCHPQRTAAALLGLVRGIIEHCVSTPLTEPIHDVTREMVDVALRGVITRGG